MSIKYELLRSKLRSIPSGKFFLNHSSSQQSCELSWFKNKVASNTIYQLIGKLITSLTTLLGTVLITRFLGVETFGEYSVVTAYAAVFYMMADFGVNAIVIREFAKDEMIAKKNFAKVLLLRILFGFVLLVIGSILLLFLPYEFHIKQAILISMPLVIFNSVSKASDIIFQSYLKYKYQAISMSIGSLIGVFLIAYAALGPYTGLISIVIAVVVGSFIAPIVSLYFVRQYISKQSRWIDFGYWRHVLTDSYPFGISLLLNTLMIYADRLLLSVLSTPRSVGIYSLSYKIFDLVLVLPTFLMNATYPLLVKLKIESEEKYSKVVSAILLVMVMFATIITIFGILLSPYIIPSIWGSEMADSSLAFNILLLGAIAFFVSSPLSWIILIEGKQKLLPKLYGFAFLFNVVFNILFIPKYDYIGAAIITVITEIIVVIILYTNIVFVYKWEKPCGN